MVIQNENTNKGKDWTKVEDYLLMEMYPYVESSAVAAQLERTVSAVEHRACFLNIKKIWLDEGEMILIYKGERVRSQTIKNLHHFTNALRDWYFDIKPALKRGEKIQIELQYELKKN